MRVARALARPSLTAATRARDALRLTRANATIARDARQRAANVRQGFAANGANASASKGTNEWNARERTASGARARRARSARDGALADVERSLDDDDENERENEMTTDGTSSSDARGRSKGNWGEESGRKSRAVSAKTSIEGEVFRPRERLKTNADFDRVKREGRTFNGAHVRVRAADNAQYEPATCTRLGVVVPKKQVRRAVDRNLLKRRIRHVFRTNKDRWPPDVDMIVFVNGTALEGGFEGVRDDLFAWADGYASRATQAAHAKERKAQKRARGMIGGDIGEKRDVVSANVANGEKS